MKINLNNFDEEEDDLENYEKHAAKKYKLTGKQSVKQLVSQASNPTATDAKFESHDLNELSRQGFLDELISGIKTGKEASVYLGRNPEGFVAVKIYTDLRVRSFRRDDTYRQGRYIGDERIERAIEQGSRKGLDAHQILWVQEEFRQLNFLHAYGVRVPKPVAVSGITLLMEFIGDKDGTPAPRIADLKLAGKEAENAFRQAIDNLKLIVKSGRVHGDYSAYNLLWHNEKTIVIDFPQTIEFQNNPNAQTLLERDIQSLCKSFKKHGIKADEAEILKEVRER
jgi:RIO kinase 1